MRCFVAVLSVVLVAGCGGGVPEEEPAPVTPPTVPASRCVLNDGFPCSAAVSAYGRNIVINVDVLPGTYAAGNRTDCVVSATPFVTESSGGATIRVSLSCPTP